MQRLPESELDIMLALWESDEERVPRAYFDQKLAHKEWSANALNSFLARLEDRGFLRSTKEGRGKLYSPVILREEYLSREGKSMLKKLYNNSLKNFLLSISDNQALDDEEIDELQQYLSRMKKGEEQ